MTINTKIIDGRDYAKIVYDELKPRIALLKQKGITPGLATVIVGARKDSQQYVDNKVLMAKELGMNSFKYELDATADPKALLAMIQQLNDDPKINGILVQMPLAAPMKDKISAETIFGAVDPKKDVDGFHPDNVAKLQRGEEDGFIPCTPLGALKMLKGELGDNLRGKKAVVLGRSHIVGRPMADLLRAEGCTVEVIHSQTPKEDVPGIVGTGDIVVAAVGKKQMLKGEWLKTGATVIDVGINPEPVKIRLPDGTEEPVMIKQPDGSEVSKMKTFGDVDTDSCKGIAAAVSRVPFGAGPMTIACLMENTYKAAVEQHRELGIRRPDQTHVHTR